MKLKFLILISISTLVIGCANQGVKAPCDYHGHFYGIKTKINNW